MGGGGDLITGLSPIKSTGGAISARGGGDVGSGAPATLFAGGGGAVDGWRSMRVGCN